MIKSLSAPVPSQLDHSLEGEIFYPSQEIIENATVKEYETLYRQSVENPEGFWSEQADELEWFQKWDRVLDDSNPPFYKWFLGGKTNIVYNAIDRHQKTWRKNKLALIGKGEPGDVRTFSYYALNREICKFANILRSMGVKRGISSPFICRVYPSRLLLCFLAQKLAPFTAWYTGVSA